MFTTGIILGLFIRLPVGNSIGFFTAALMAAARRAEDQAEMLEKQLKET